MVFSTTTSASPRSVKMGSWSADTVSISGSFSIACKCSALRMAEHLQAYRKKSHDYIKHLLGLRFTKQVLRGLSGSEVMAYRIG